MKYISHRIGNLELRRAENIMSGEHYLEIIEWLKDEKQEDYCYTIAVFKEEKEGYAFESVLDRILIDKEKWKDLGVLVRFGFEFLKDAEVVKPEQEVTNGN